MNVEVRPDEEADVDVGESDNCVWNGERKLATDRGLLFSSATEENTLGRETRVGVVVTV